MSSENPSHSNSSSTAATSAIKGADSLSYASGSGLVSRPQGDQNQNQDEDPSTTSLSNTTSSASGSGTGLATYEERARSSGLVSKRTGPGAHEMPQPSAKSGTSSHNEQSSVAEGRNNHDSKTMAATSTATGGGEHFSGSSESRDYEGGKTGDSKGGKLMEKAGKVLHSQKLADKGEAKREKAAAGVN